MRDPGLVELAGGLELVFDVVGVDGVLEVGVTAVGAAPLTERTLPFEKASKRSTTLAKGA